MLPAKWQTSLGCPAGQRSASLRTGIKAGSYRTQRRGQLIDRSRAACQNLGCYHSGIWRLKRRAKSFNRKERKGTKENARLPVYSTLRCRQRELKGLMVALAERNDLGFGGGCRRLMTRRPAWR